MKTTFDYIIIGAGPAGVQLAYFLSQKGRDYAVLERNTQSGSFFETFPRHRMLISINKIHTGSADPEFNMRHDWNSLLTNGPGVRFGIYDQAYFPRAENLVRYLNDFANAHRLNIHYNTMIEGVSRENDGFRIVTAQGGAYWSRYVIVATGLSKPNIPPIPGIDLAENYNDMSIDRAEFVNQRVLIIGKGNSAFETADHLIPVASIIHLVSPRPLAMAWATHYVGNLRAVNNNILDTYQLKSQNAILDADVLGIRKNGDRLLVSVRYVHAEDEIEEIAYDRVLCCTGFRVDTAIFDASCRPALTLNDRYPQLTQEFESVDQPGLYFAGTLTHSLDYRKATSGFIHGFRYNVRALSRIFDHTHHHEPLQGCRLACDADALATHILDRVNRSGGLWQQPGFMGDALVCNDNTVTCIEEMPLGYIKATSRAAGTEVFVVTLEYGEAITGDLFNVTRIHRENIEQAHRSQFLHPVVRYVRNGEVQDEHHVIEDLEAKWVEDEHFAPLSAALESWIVQHNAAIPVAPAYSIRTAM